MEDGDDYGLQDITSFFSNGFTSAAWVFENDWDTKGPQGWTVAPSVDEDGTPSLQACLRHGADVTAVTTVGRSNFTQRVERSYGDTLVWAELAQREASGPLRASSGVEVVDETNPAAKAKYGGDVTVGRETQALNVHASRGVVAAQHPKMLYLASAYLGVPLLTPGDVVEKVTLGAVNILGKTGMHAALTHFASPLSGRTPPIFSFMATLPEVKVTVPLPNSADGVPLGWVRAGVRHDLPRHTMLMSHTSLVVRLRTPSPNVSVQAKYSVSGYESSLSLSTTLARVQAGVASLTPSVTFATSADGSPVWSYGVKLVSTA